MRSLPKGQTFPYADGTGDPLEFQFNALAAPHAETVRATYTVPPGKVVLINSSSMFLGRVAAAAPTLSAHAHIRLTRDNGKIIQISHLHFQSTTTSIGYVMSLIHNLIMTTGDNLVLITSDASTGGVIDYNAVVAMTEFDS